MKKSYYFHRQSWSIDTQPPGLRVGTIGALLIPVILGGLFVVFLPVIGFVLAGQALLSWVARPLVRALTHGISPVAVGETHLTGHRSEGVSGPPKKGGRLDRLAKEIKERRG